MNRVEIALMEQPKDTLAYGPDLKWAFWIGGPSDAPLLMTAPAYGPDNRVVELPRAIAIVSTMDVTSFVLGLELQSLIDMAERLEAWLKAPRFRRMLDVIRERARAITQKSDLEPAMQSVA